MTLEQYVSYESALLLLLANLRCKFEVHIPNANRSSAVTVCAYLNQSIIFKMASYNGFPNASRSSALTICTYLNVFFIFKMASLARRRSLLLGCLRWPVGDPNVLQLKVLQTGDGSVSPSSALRVGISIGSG